MTRLRNMASRYNLPLIYLHLLDADDFNRQIVVVNRVERTEWFAINEIKAFAQVLARCCGVVIQRLLNPPRSVYDGRFRLTCYCDSQDVVDRFE